MKVKTTIKKVIYAIIGIFLIGLAVAFNASAGLGNDSVGILYDGVRNLCNLTQAQLGVASNVVNICLIILVFFIGRRYVNVGTFIYILPYGFFVSLGNKIYNLIMPDAPGLSLRIAAVVVGCLSLYIGIALYITADMGLDPFTGFVMVLVDFFKKEYRIVKICFDICCVIIGFVMGGKLGVVTVATVCTAGPLIQMFSNIFKKIDKKFFSFEKINNIEDAA